MSWLDWLIVAGSALVLLASHRMAYIAGYLARMSDQCRFILMHRTGDPRRKGGRQ
jgi:Sec-independent protein translocase protein TatA